MTWLPPYAPTTREEDLAAAAHWESLAAEMEARSTWDRSGSPKSVASRVALYRQVAADIRAKMEA